MKLCHSSVLRPQLNTNATPSITPPARVPDRWEATAVKAKSDVDLAAVRQRARENGHTVSDRGRVPATIVDAYKNANA